MYIQPPTVLITQINANRVKHNSWELLTILINIELTCLHFKHIQTINISLVLR